MILADKIAQEIMGSEYFQSLFVICMERSYYQILNLCKSIQYKEKESSKRLTLFGFHTFKTEHQISYLSAIPG